GRAGLAAIWRTMNGESLVHVIERILGPLVDAAGAQGAFHAVGHERDRAIADGDTGKWREGQRHGTLRCDDATDATGGTQPCPFKFRHRGMTGGGPLSPASSP